MVPIKSLDHVVIITSLLTDIQQMLGQEIYTPRSLRLDIQKIKNRYSAEGIGFLTKTLPHLGKALDRALTGELLDSPGFKTEPQSKIPKLFGSLFKRVFSHDGRVLQDPCTNSVRLLRQITFVYYKYEIPYHPTLEQKVVAQFEKTEQDLLPFTDCQLCNLRVARKDIDELIIKARRLLQRSLCNFDVHNIVPRHGPGVVSTKEQLSEKFRFTRWNERIASVYPIDAYYYASLSHVCDRLQEFRNLEEAEPTARVILVPKDSRGPRLISCEPLEFQWIQQGLSRAVVAHVESHHMTRGIVNFTDQSPNRNAALMGSVTGHTCTLDLKEASDRVSAGLVRQLFPEHLRDALLATRTIATTLPDGRILKLRKFAPMGSALCFPTLALTIWAVLSSDWDAESRKRLLVYGDDVIVPAGKTANAIEKLEKVGLLVNRSKSCTSGFFRESCGMDAFKGVDVTPVRFRTVWSSTPSASVYTSWISYANSLYERGFYGCADYIAASLLSIYKTIPVSENPSEGFPALRFDHPNNTVPRSRTNYNLQKREWLVRVVEPHRSNKSIDGWSMLLRWFTEGCRVSPLDYLKKNDKLQKQRSYNPLDCQAPFSSRAYTHRRRNKLRFRWR